MPATETPAPWPDLLRDKDAARLLGCSRRTLWKEVAVGRLPAPVKLSFGTRWKLSTLREFIEALEATK
jgi:predicted DNA-binding transcriptional regulator AlpA